MRLYEVLRRPLLSERTTLLKEKNKYAFEVAYGATKPQIREAVELAFKVKVTGVNVLNVPGKTKRFGKRQVTAPSWKKAIVTLEPGNTIELFEGV